MATRLLHAALLAALCMLGPACEERVEGGCMGAAAGDAGASTGTMPTCSGGSSCTCGASSCSCTGGACTGTCGASCTLTCKSGSTCDVTVETGGFVLCAGGSKCTFTVPAGARPRLLECEGGSAMCSFVCHGACDYVCEEGASCSKMCLGAP